MRSGRTYEVFVGGKPVGLVGSTVRTLKQRRSNRYIARFGPTVELRLIREVPRHESEDDISYNFHLKAAEALDIAKRKTYEEDGGLNQMSPLIQAAGRSLLDTELGRLGGLAGGRKGGLISGRRSVENGHLARLRTPEHQSAAGRIGGRIGGPRGSRESKVCAGQMGSQKGLCQRWNINRGKPCVCGNHR
jgi:hypothetical protein